MVAKPTTLVEGVELLHSLPSGALAVLDTLDSADLPGDLTASRKGYTKAWRSLAQQAIVLLRKRISLLLLSQLRYLGPGVGVKASAWYIRDYLTAGIRMRKESTESKFGKRTWTQVELACTLNRRSRAKYSGTVFFHPELGYCPELEILQALRAELGAGWRSLLGISLPTGREEAVLYLRHHPEVLEHLWEELTCQEK